MSKYLQRRVHKYHANSKTKILLYVSTTNDLFLPTKLARLQRDTRRSSAINFETLQESYAPKRSTRVNKHDSSTIITEAFLQSSFHTEDRDCITECLTHLFTYRDDQFVEHVQTRNVVCSINKELRSIAIRTPAFWDQIVLSQQVSIDALRTWVANAPTTSLKVKVEFRNLHQYYHRGAASVRICNYTRTALPILLPSASRWSSLSLEIEDADCARLWILALRHPALRPYSLSALAMNWSDTTNIPLPTTPATNMNRLPHDILPGGNVHLLSLSLTSGAIEWSHLHCYQYLVFLEFSSDGGRVQASELRAVLHAAVTLEHLVFGGMNVDHEHIHPNSNTVVFPVLHTLELKMSLNHDFGTFVGSFDLPILSKLVLQIPRNSFHAFDACFHRRQIFSGVNSLRIRTEIPGNMEEDWPATWSTGGLFQHFPAVVDLHLVEATPLIFKLLAKKTMDDEVNDFPSGVLLPKLEKLALAPAALSLVADYLNVRMRSIGARSLHQLEVHCLSEEEKEETVHHPQWNAVVRNALTTMPLTLPVARFAAREP
ncbi:hypothetical protein C8R43DRAFT_958621 [Mycena crocata]|nr:hypothetical protein C8R43DRAFT_958621 [Mycena crocata]